MRQVLNYNIHNILKFQIVKDKKRGLSYLSNPEVFQVDEMEKPDIVLNIGRFTPSNKNCYLVDYKYHVKDNYLYCRDSGGNIVWAIEISGLDRGQITINFAGHNGFEPRYHLLPERLPQSILGKLIEYKLSLKGCYSIHSAVVSKGDQAYLICGRSGSFKTSLCMDFVRRTGFSCLGDDRVILHQGKALSFFLHPSLFQFMTDHLPDERHFGLLKQAHFLRQILRGSYRTKKQEGGWAKLKALLLITRTTRQDEKVIFNPVPEAYLDQIVDRLVINNQLEDFNWQLPAFEANSAPFFRYRQAYSFIFPDSSIATYEVHLAEGLKGILQKIPIYQVEIPFNYSLKVFEQVQQLVAEQNGS